ncbi:MAG: amino acid permease [Robiginitomaculum sp.]|nr:amino acid permease [Robiginitomaculum sp.]
MSKFKFRTATAVVIANMIGTGVFTSLGYQLEVIRSPFVLLSLWVIGGIVALCGAMSYAELGSSMPRSGGEYNFLTRIYHPAMGFVSGWVSALIGFAAPIALVAILFGTYLVSAIPGVEPGGVEVKILAAGLVLAMTLIHATNHRNSGGTQLVFTVLKIAFIVLFCVGGLLLVPEPQAIGLLPAKGDGALMLGSAYAISLIYVSYAYTGWNAVTYMSGEVENPTVNIPKILFIATFTVMLSYIALNYMFLKTAPMEAMSGKLEIGFIAAEHAFGSLGAKFIGFVLALLLISTVSAMVIAGPRVLQVLGEDFSLFKGFAKTNADGIPNRAVWFQTVLTLVFIVTSSFEQILVFSAALLALNSFFAVMGLFVLRWRQPDLERPYRVWAYPITPLVYLALTGFTLVFVALSRPVEAIGALVIISSGLVFYFIAQAFERRKQNS